MVATHDEQEMLMRLKSELLTIQGEILSLALGQDDTHASAKYKDLLSQLTQTLNLFKMLSSAIIRRMK